MDNSLRAKLFSSGKQTPYYFYDLELLQNTLSLAKEQADKRGFHVHYALKANCNERVLTKIQQEGFGADCVSGNEVLKALDKGFPASKITFAGVGKSDHEIQIALKNNIFAFNVESAQELEVIAHWAKAANRIARISLRINPNVDAKTHKYITTGLDDNKFGLPAIEIDKAVETLRANKHLEFIGLHFHIGSQITDLAVFKNLALKANQWRAWFEEQGLEVKVLNMGGGLGVSYEDPDLNPIVDFQEYFSIFDKYLERPNRQEVHFELGRSMVAQCGSLVTKVLYVKDNGTRKFVIVDAGMTELLRPALYQAFHKIEKLQSSTEETQFKYDVVGPICESSDSFGEQVELGEVERGDLLVIRSAGAYGEVMASNYNLREELRFVYNDTIES